MVNTRRKDSLSSHDVGSPRYQTRRKYNYNEEGRQDSEKYYESGARIADSPDVEGREEQEEVEDDSSSEEFKISTIELQNTNKARELRSRFVSNNQFSNSGSYTRTRRHDHTSRSGNRKVVSINKRPSLMVFKSSRKMLNDESDVCSPSMRNHRMRHDHHKQHRRSLSLRPITRKSYNDKCYLTDSDQEEDINVRRSSRITGNRRNYNMSWLVDEQMHKVGYPNLGGYYDDDSIEAEIPNNCRLKSKQETYCDAMTTASGENNATEDTARDTDEYIPPGHIASNGNMHVRHRLRASTTSATSGLQRDKENSDANINTKSIEDKMGVVKLTRQRSKILCDGEADGTALCGDDAEGGVLQKSPTSISPPTDHANQEIDESTIAARIGRRTRGTYVRSRMDVDGGHEGEGKQFVEAKPDGTLRDNSSVEAAVNQDDSKDVPSDYEIRRTRRNMRRSGIISSNEQSCRNRKASESSTSSEVSRKGYSLRNRSKMNFKMSPMIISSNRHSQRRFNLRRRKPPQNMSSSASSDSDNDEYRTPKKYNNAKSSYAKIDHKSNAGNSKMSIRPEQMDGTVRFSSVGGLDSHIQCLKEMILLPMMYPEVFNRFQIQPPRGILFHGPPGTGKTLIARALANECSFGSRKLTFFMRKGADLLCKWVGESEKQLRLLFDQACEMKPSIIFFDELDGLAPVRSARNDQFHASIVSTLLALMDGLNNRGEVIVIGATNRVDAIDPALRRPGRFDRELYFPLPARKEREEILKVHVAKWQCPPSAQLISYLAESAVGYCGSDLRALCSEAVIQSFRRVYPQVYSADHILLLNPENVKVERIDFLRAKSMLVPAAHRVVQNLGRKLLPVLTPLLEGPMTAILNILGKSFPHGTNPALAKVKLSAGFKPAQLLIFGDGPNHGQLYLAQALLQHMEHIHTHSLDLAALHRQSGITPEEACIQVFHEAKRNVPSVIYIPRLNSFWELASKTVQAIFISQVASMDPNLPILILATSDITYSAFDTQIQYLFSQYRYELFQLRTVSYNMRAAFFRPLIVDASIRAPRSSRTVRIQTPPPLPRAPTPPPPPLSPAAAERIFESEERTLSELRIFLRDMCKKLANNRLFFIFTKPVDIEEVPDYPTIIKEPMDLETMMTKVDLHSYQCAKDFLADIDLICQNALEYNPAKTSADKQIRHRACSLRDYAFTLIKNEMDSDFEDKCQEIARKRKERKASVAQYLSPYLHTAASTRLGNNPSQQITTNVQNKVADHNSDTTTKGCGVLDVCSASGSTGTASTSTNNSHNSSSVVSAPTTVTTVMSAGSTNIRKRRIPSWQRGYVTNSKRRRQHRAQRSLPFLNAVVQEKYDGKEQSSEGDESKIILDTTSLNSLNHNNLDEKITDKKSSPNLMVSGSEANVQENSINPTMQELVIDTSNTDVTVAYCVPSDHMKLDLSAITTSSICKRRLSDLLSPSELLNDHLEFDDIDQTLNESAKCSTQSSTIQVSKSVLDGVLVQVAEATNEQPLQVLLDLYYQLSRIVKMYSATLNRNQLPQDLLKELDRFSTEKERENIILNESDFFV